MKTPRIIVAPIALAAALAVSAGSAKAQDPVTAAAIAAPIISKAISAIAPKKNPPGNWLKGVVVHFDAHTLIVREEVNERAIHTFSYAPEIKDQMQQLMNAGGFQYGDSVKILFQQNNSVAVKVVGKPSKPL